MELKGVCSGASGTWTAAELQLDGTSVATWSGSVGLGATITPVFGTNSNAGASGLTINFDDYALNDATGSVNNTWCGAGSVIMLLPTADSAVGTGWTLGNGTATGGNAHGSVDNTPPLGVADLSGASADSGQIRNAANSANSNYDATMATYTAAGLPAGATVNAVVPVICTAAPVTTSAKQGTVGVVSNPAITNIALSSTGTAGAFWAGAAASTYGAGWKWSNGTMTETPTVTAGTAPVMRVTQVTGSTRIAMVCFMGIYVDYTAAAAAVTRVPRNPAINIIDPAVV